MAMIMVGITLVAEILMALLKHKNGVARNILQDNVAVLEATVNSVEQLADRMEIATRYCNEVLPLMQKIREAADALELRVPDDLWALPNYEEILFDK